MRKVLGRGQQNITPIPFIPRGIRARAHEGRAGSLGIRFDS